MHAWGTQIDEMQLTMWRQ